MSRYKAKAPATGYWRPGDNYIEKILQSVKDDIDDGDFIVISEKALSTALGSIVDESRIKPGFNAKILAWFWMRIIWGYILGPLCHMQDKLIRRMRHYPIDEGSRHKQLALQQAGLLNALMFGSEGGIDGSNLPYSYVSLPLENAEKVAEEIRQAILYNLKKHVCVMIVDTDRTFSIFNFHFTHRPKPIKGIHSMPGIVAYVLGRMLKLKSRATPIAVSGAVLNAEEALRIADFANKVRGSGSGKTVWDMAETFRVNLTSVSWEMLEMIEHKPIVIVRLRGVDADHHLS